MRVGCLHGVLGHKRTIIEQLLALTALPSQNYVQCSSLSLSPLSSSSFHLESMNDNSSKSADVMLLPPPVLLVAWRAHKGEVSGLEHSVLPMPHIDRHFDTADYSSFFAFKKSGATSILPVRGSISSGNKGCGGNSSSGIDLFPQLPPPFLVACRLSEVELISWAKMAGVGKIWSAKVVELSSSHKIDHGSGGHDHVSSTGKTGYQNQGHHHRAKHRRSSMHTGTTFTPTGIGYNTSTGQKGKSLHDAEIVSREHFATVKLKAEVSHVFKNDEQHRHRRHHHHHHHHRTFAYFLSLNYFREIKEMKSN